RCADRVDPPVRRDRRAGLLRLALAALESLAADPTQPWQRPVVIRARVGRVGLAGLLALLATAMLAAGCGGRSSGQGVASLGTATATARPAVQRVSDSSPANTALAFVSCMRTHGEPNMPEPSVGKTGGHVSVSIDAGSGVDPNSQLFTAAFKACKHLLPNNGAASKGDTITAADQKVYLEAAGCMRAHGIPGFPDPTFRNGDVSFNSRTPIDTNAPRYTSALTTCRK